MKRNEKLPRLILTVGFLAVIVIFGVMTVVMNGKSLVTTTRDAFVMSRSEGNGVFESISNGIDALETEYNMVFFSKSSFLVGNSLVKKCLGNRFFPSASDDMNMVKLADGSIGKVKFALNSENLRPSIAKFKAYMDELDIPVVFVYVHSKVLDDSQIPFGSLDRSNLLADRFLKMLEEEGVDYLDTRDVLLSSDLPADQLYFRTDTHWTVPSAFLAYQALAEKLNAEYGFSIDEKYIDADNYETTLYEDRFVGSYGNQTTPYYTGVEDFVTVTPKFPSHIVEMTQRNDNNWEYREGDFSEAVMYPVNLIPDEGHSYSTRCYQAYNYNWGEILYENDAEDASDNRLLIIKNSAGNPVTDFMALGVKNVCGLDRRNLTRATIADYVADYKPDVVVIVYSYDFLRTDRLAFFTTPAHAENLGD